MTDIPKKLLHALSYALSLITVSGLRNINLASNHLL